MVILDQTVRMLRRGYEWAPGLRAGRSAVRTRVLGRPAALVGGPDGTRRFYDPRLQRHGAIPAAVRLVLFGPGAVHGLDDAEHRDRKRFLLDVLAPDRIEVLTELAIEAWSRRVAAWRPGEQVCVYDEAVAVLGETVLPWAGVDPADQDLGARARELAAVVDGFATPGPDYARAVMARGQLNRWAAGLVDEARSGRRAVRPESVLGAVAYGEPGGQRLPHQTAATEFLNIVRPTVAVAWFITFSALILHDHPQWRTGVQTDSQVRLAVAQEIRRIVPFVPVLAAQARHDQDVLGIPVRQGGLVVLDVYGTNHDPVHWPDPEAFDPDRFLTGDHEPDALIPQGGGSVTDGHRCPGEDVTLMMIMTAIQVLSGVDFELAGQDLFCSLRRVPTKPRNGVIITKTDHATEPDASTPLAL